MLDEIEQNKFLCVNNDIICHKEFDEGNDNNWKESSLRRYLNGEYLEKFKDVNLASWQQDLTTDDGLKEYGSSEDRIFLLTAEQYRKYRKNIRAIIDWWWLITADSTVNDLVRFVYTDGSLTDNGAYGGYYGVRPACVIDISI